MKSLQDIKDTIELNKALFKKKYHLKSIAIFGFYSREQQKEGSDIDVMVEFDKAIGIKFIDFAQELEQILGMRVDVVSKKGVKPKYLHRIKEDLIYV